MRDRIEGAISAYRKENWQRIEGGVDWRAIADSDLPDSYFIKIFPYGFVEPDIQSPEDLKRKIEEAKFLNEAKKACGQLTDAITDMLNTVLVDGDILSHIKLSIQWKVRKTGDGKEVGSWSIVPRVLTPKDYE